MKRSVLHSAFYFLGILPCAFGVSYASDLSLAEHILNSPALPLPETSTTFPDLSSEESDGTNLSVYGDIGCFVNPPPPAPPSFDLIIPFDYLKLLEKIVVDDDSIMPFQRFFRPGDFKRQYSGRCSLQMGIVPGQPGQSSTPIRMTSRSIDSAHLAAKIAQKCFVGGLTLGGTVRYGPHLQLLVVLGATKSSPPTVATS